MGSRQLAATQAEYSGVDLQETLLNWKRAMVDSQLLILNHSAHICTHVHTHTPIIKLLCQPRIKWMQPRRHSLKYDKGKSGINTSVYSEVNTTVTRHYNFSIFPPLCSSGNTGLLSKVFSQSFAQSWRRSPSWQAHDPCRRPLTHTQRLLLLIKVCCVIFQKLLFLSLLDPVFIRVIPFWPIALSTRY